MRNIICFILFLPLLLLLSLPSAHAFNWKTCKDKLIIKKVSNPNSVGGAIMQTTFYFTTGSFFSTSSFVSSTGPCKAFGLREIERTQFIASNLADISIDVAAGQGENLVALSQLYGCPDSQIFLKNLKSNYTRIFLEISSAESFEISERIHTLIDADPFLARTCFI